MKNWQFRNWGIGVAAIVTVVGLIRCVPSEPDAGQDAEVSAKVQEAEAAEAKSVTASSSTTPSSAKSATDDKPKDHPKEKSATNKDKKKSKVAKSEAGEEKSAKKSDEKKASQKPATDASDDGRNVAAKMGGHGSLYVVQIGAFKVKENAEKLTKHLKDAGYPVRMTSMTHSKNGDLHLVRFEPTPNKSEATDAIEKLQAKESLRATLLTLPAGG